MERRHQNICNHPIPQHKIYVLFGFYFLRYLFQKKFFNQTFVCIVQHMNKAIQLQLWWKQCKWIIYLFVMENQQGVIQTTNFTWLNEYISLLLFFKLDLVLKTSTHTQRESHIIREFVLWFILFAEWLSIHFHVSEV